MIGRTCFNLLPVSRRYGAVLFDLRQRSSGDICVGGEMAEPMLCTQCGTVAAPRRVTPGSGWITLVLLCFFIVPGLIYWIWRHTSTYAACANCGSKNVIPHASPVAREMISTRPAVAASLQQEVPRRKDTRVGTAVAIGIIVLIVLLSKISSCSH